MAANLASIQRDTFAFSFVLAGTMSLVAGELASTGLAAGDAFVVPTGMSQRFSDCSSDWQMLQVVVSD